MGYAMYIVDSQFRIPDDARRSALQSIKSLMYDPEADAIISCSCGNEFNTFAWMHHVDHPSEWDSIDDALEAWRFEPVYDGARMTGLDFTGQKIGDEAQMFEAIAPYVEEGSYIHFEGEDGSEFMLYFHDDDLWQATRNGDRKAYDL